MKQLFETVDLEAELFPEFADNDENFSESDMDDFPSLELMLELADGRSLEYELAGVFVFDEKEYAVLHPKTDTEGVFHLMELTQGEDDEIRLLPVEDDIWEAVEAAFHRYFKDEGEFQETIEIIEDDTFIENEEIEGE